MIPNTSPAAIIAKSEHFLPLLIPASLRLLGAIAICIAGIWLSGKSEYLAAKLLSRLRHVDTMLRDFFANIVRYFVLTVTGLTVLSQFGVQTTSLVAVIGAASLAIGLALQGTLSNLAAGIMLLIFRPFRLGQQVQVSGNTGTAKELTLFWTEIVTPDNVQIIVPNSQVWGTALKNMSTYAAPPATIDIRFPATEANLASTKDLITRIMQTTPGVAPTPAPSVLADRAPTDNTLQIAVKFSADPASAADTTKSAIIEAVVAAMNAGTVAREGQAAAPGPAGA